MRSSTENIYQEKVNRIINYIGSHLCEPLLLDVMADLIHTSQRQLLRIMRSALSESLHSYVVRQRMERAVMYMQMEEVSLSALAQMVGYDNPQSFSKAFKKQFGVAPKTYMKELKARLINSVQSNTNQKNNLQSEVCEVENMELVYIRIIGKYGDEELYKTAWYKLISFLKDKQTLSANTRYIGLSFDDPNITKAEHCRFYACASVNKKITPTGEFGTIQLPKGKYAVYVLKGSCSGLQELYNNINLNFGYTSRYGMAFEEYITYSEENKENQITKVYIPIK